MKFGKTEDLQDLDKINWELPKFKIEAPSILSAKPSNSCIPIEIRTGGTMWSIRPWRGKVYPYKKPMRTWPKYYGEQFGSIEFNATHYRIYSQQKMAQWAQEMPVEFRFCPKFPSIISHYRRFANCEGPTDDFIDGLMGLGGNLGPAFLQLPPHYAPKHSDNLIPYLRAWPRELKMALEFRHPDWFKKGERAEELWQLLSELGIGAVISDTALRRDALHMRITSDFVIVRFGGYPEHPSDVVRIKQWASSLKNLAEAGVKSFDFLVHTSDSIETPETCIKFSEEVQSRIDIKVTAPAFINDSPK